MGKIITIFGILSLLVGCNHPIDEQTIFVDLCEEAHTQKVYLEDGTLVGYYTVFDNPSCNKILEFVEGFGQ